MRRYIEYIFANKYFHFSSQLNQLVLHEPESGVELIQGCFIPTADCSVTPQLGRLTDLLVSKSGHPLNVSTSYIKFMLYTRD